MVQSSCRTHLFPDALNAINLPLIRRLHHMSSLGDAAMTEEALTKSTVDRVPFLQRVIPVRFVMDLCLGAWMAAAVTVKDPGDMVRTRVRE